MAGVCYYCVAAKYHVRIVTDYIIIGRQVLLHRPGDSVPLHFTESINIIWPELHHARVRAYMCVSAQSSIQLQ